MSGSMYERLYTGKRFRFVKTTYAAGYDHLLPFSLHEPEIWKYSLLQGGGGESQNYLQIAVTAREEGKEYPFIVFDKRQIRMPAVQVL